MLWYHVANFRTVLATQDDEKISKKCMTQNVASIMITKLRQFKKSAQHVIEVETDPCYAFQSKSVISLRC